MKIAKHLIAGLHLIMFSALTGCTTYGEPPRDQVVYAPAPIAEVSVVIRSEGDFYEPLSPYGRWENVGGNGRCWIPAQVGADWRPYCNGAWQRTDAGWYWESDEPWAWATYHYGRWDFDAQLGWFWMPETQWAPAWVSWHEGGGYVGWAPLRPSDRFSGNGIVSVSVIAPRAYVFVEQRHFLEPVRTKTVIINNTTIINKTVNITNVKIVNNTIINEGPHTTVIEQASGKKVRSVPVRELRQKHEAPVIARQRSASTIVPKQAAPITYRQPAPRAASVPAPQIRPTIKPVVVKRAPMAVVPEILQAPHARTKPVALPPAELAPVKHQGNRSVQPNRPVMTRGSEASVNAKGKGNQKQRSPKADDKGQVHQKDAKEPQGASEKNGRPQ